MYRGHDEDIEKLPSQFTVFPKDASPDPSTAVPIASVPGDSLGHGASLYAKIQRIVGKLHIEQRGIERVPEDERTDTSLFNIGSMVRVSRLANPNRPFSF